MDIQTVGSASYLITVTGEELESLGASADLSDADALRLIGRALPEGVKASGRAAFEVYPGKDELMIFVRIGGCMTAVYRFSGFEDLLAAAKLCPDMFRSELFRDGEEYILTLTPWDASDVPCSIGEFGTRLNIGEELLPHLREQLECVIPFDAVRELCGAF